MSLKNEIYHEKNNERHHKNTKLCMKNQNISWKKTLNGLQKNMKFDMEIKLLPIKTTKYVYKNIYSNGVPGLHGSIVQ